MSRALRAASGAAAALATQGVQSPAGPAALFHVAAREAGQERSDLPLWAVRPEGDHKDAFRFLFGKGSGGDSCQQPEVSKRDVGGVVGGFQIFDVLSSEECSSFVDVLDSLGFHADAAVSLPYSFRHMENCNVVVPDEVADEIFQRCKHLLPDMAGLPPLGLNAKFRCYRYGPGDYFKPHTDGAWPGTRASNGSVVMDGYGDRLSQLTFLILLTDGYEGGGTQFFREGGVVESAAVRTPLGGALVFPHGHHPDSPLHAGMQVHSGTKYIIRTEVLYSLEALGRLGRL